MKTYLSHYAAALMWNIPYIDAVLGKNIIKDDAANITVSGQNERYRYNGKWVRSCGLDIPESAIKKLNGKLVASPELVFLELGSILSIHRLILLGLQLCSHPPGAPSKAITTKRKLTLFLARAGGHRGHRKAVRAVKYIENGSASIMESLTYMILTLPYTLGGYGLDGAVFNYEIELQCEGKKRLGQNHCFADLYYKQAKLAVEYDSFTHHNSPLEQGKDAMRSAILKKQGIEVLHLNTVQLYDNGACNDFVSNLATHLGKRIHIRTKKFDEMHAHLKTLLPAGIPDNISYAYGNTLPHTF